MKDIARTMQEIRNVGSIVPRRFEEARIEKRLTQNALADKSGISRVTISKIENGLLLKPNMNVVTGLAWSLGKPLEFFYKDNEKNYRDTTPISFRCYKSKSSIDNQITDIKLERAQEFVQYLYGHVNKNYLDIIPEEISAEDAVTIDRIDIEGIAYRTREKWNLTQGPIIGLITLLENHGIICCSVDLPKKIDSINVSFSFDDEQREVSLVLYNENLNYFRQRFSLAHELGHIILHHYWSKDDFLKNGNLAEDQANKFASAFLMPYESFSNSVVSTSINGVRALKDKWKTSIASICYRMKELDLISQRQYENLNIYISRNGWRKVEPDDETTQKEVPYYLNQGYSFLFTNRISSPEDVVKFVSLNPSEIVEFIGN